MVRRLFGRKEHPDDAGDGGPTDVVADSNYDREELERYAEAMTSLEPHVIAGVLDLHDEYLIAAGIMQVPDHTFVHYDPETFESPPGIVDESQLAADAYRFLGISEADATQVLEAELSYLQAKGLVE